MGAISSVGYALSTQQQRDEERNQQRPNQDEGIGRAIENPIPQRHGGDHDAHGPPSPKGQGDLPRPSGVPSTKHAPGDEVSECGRRDKRADDDHTQPREEVVTR